MHNWHLYIFIMQGILFAMTDSIFYIIVLCHVLHVSHLYAHPLVSNVDNSSLFVKSGSKKNVPFSNVYFVSYGIFLSQQSCIHVKCSMFEYICFIIDRMFSGQQSCIWCQKPLSYWTLTWQVFLVLSYASSALLLPARKRSISLSQIYSRPKPFAIFGTSEA